MCVCGEVLSVPLNQLTSKILMATETGTSRGSKTPVLNYTTKYSRNIILVFIKGLVVKYQ